MYHVDSTSVSTGSKKSFSEVLRGWCTVKKSGNGVANLRRFDLAFCHVVNSHIESFWRFVLRSENADCFAL